MIHYLDLCAEPHVYLSCRYVAKIIFTYILGYKVDIGHMEAVNLISSLKYSEKQIVSGAVCVLDQVSDDLERRVI